MKKFGILRCLKCETTYAVHCSMCKSGEIANDTYYMIHDLDSCEESRDKHIQWCWDKTGDALDVWLENRAEDSVDVEP